MSLSQVNVLVLAATNLAFCWQTWQDHALWYCMQLHPQLLSCLAIMARPLFPAALAQWT